MNGAAIASAADPSRNRLETGSLGWSDLENEAEYKASSFGISASGGSGGGGVSPNISVPQHEKSGSTTQAGIADGTLIVHDGSGEGIARGVTELQQDGLKEIFDQQKVAERMEMGQVAGQVGFTAAGDIALSKQRDAQSKYDAAIDAYKAAEQGGDTEAMASAWQSMQQAKQIYQAWTEGSTNKVVLHAVVGALQAALGGGNSLGGALGAGTSEGASNFTTNGFAAGLVGALVGGGSGAATAMDGYTFNRQRHIEEQKAIDSLMQQGYDDEQLLAISCVAVQCWLGTDQYKVLPDGTEVMTPAGNYLLNEVDRVLVGMTDVEKDAVLAALKAAAPGQFEYSTWDAYVDAVKDQNVLERMLGLGQAVLGSVEGYAIGQYCALTGGLGCSVGGTAALAQAGDNVAAGITTWWTGDLTSTWQNRLWQQMGLSPEAANYAEFGTSILTGAGMIAGASGKPNTAGVGQNRGSNEPAIASAVADSEAGMSVASHPVKPGGVSADGFNTSYQTALDGGKHAGFLRNYANKTPEEIDKGIASIERQIAEHQAKIADPEKAIPGFRSLDPRQQKALVESKWPSDIARQKEQLDILRGLKDARSK